MHQTDRASSTELFRSKCSTLSPTDRSVCVHSATRKKYLGLEDAGKCKTWNRLQTHLHNQASSKHNYMSGYYSRDACCVCREEMHEMGLSFNDSQMQLQHNILYPTTPVWRLLSQKCNLYIYCNLCIQNEEVPLVLGWTEDNIHACIYLCPRDSALTGKGYRLALDILKLLNVLLLYQ